MNEKKMKWFEIEGLDLEIKKFEKAIKRGEFDDMPLVKISIKAMRSYLNGLKIRLKI